MPGIKFDVAGAKAAGYTDAQIADALASKAEFDAAGARAAGYKDADIIGRLTAPPKPLPAYVETPEIEDPGLGQTVLIGAGRTFDRIGKGMQQLYYGAKSKIETPTLSDLVKGGTPSQLKLKQLEQQAADDDEQYQKLRDLRPVATAVGESLPSMVIPVGGSATILGTTAKMAASSAIPAALEYGSVEERLKNAGTAGAGAVVGGVVLPKAAGAAWNAGKSALRGMVGNVTPEAVELAAKAKALGIPVNAAQLGDSKFLKTLSSAIEQMPFTGGAKSASQQRAAFTKAVSNTFGDNVEKITPEVYAANKARLGKTFDDLAMRNTLNVDDALMTRLESITSEANQMAGDDTIRAVNNAVDRLLKQSVAGAAPGEKLPFKYKAVDLPDMDGAVKLNMKEPILNVNTAALIPSQPTLKTEGVEKYVTGKGQFSGKPIEVLVQDGKYVVVDGHHRAAAALQSGKQFIPAKIIGEIKSNKVPVVESRYLKAPQDTKIEVPGAAYSSIDSMLSKAIKGGGEKGNYLKEVQAAVRDAMDRSISPADQAAWTTARTQYKNLKAVRDIVARDAGDGNIPPQQLLNALNSSEAGKEAMAMGARGQLGELGRIGRQFVRDSVPNSGTAQRAMAMGLIGGGGYAFGAEPTQIAGMLVGGATAGRLINKIMQNPKTVEALSKQGMTLADLMKMPPARLTQILGGTAGMTTAENMRD